jgi:hypothetical protein
MFSLKSLISSCAVLFLFAYTFNHQSNVSGITFSSIVEHQHVLSAVPWTVGDSAFLCVVSERQVNNNQETAPSRTMSVYRQDGQTLSKIFEFQTLDNFLNAYPLSEEEGRLFVSWVGGSSYHFRAYALTDGKVKQVLDASSRGMPEFRINNDESELILITHKTFVKGQWIRTNKSITDVYQWNGQMYEVVASVPWEQRLTVPVSRKPGAAQAGKEKGLLPTSSPRQ